MGWPLPDNNQKLATWTCSLVVKQIPHKNEIVGSNPSGSTSDTDR